MLYFLRKTSPFPQMKPPSGDYLFKYPMRDISHLNHYPESHYVVQADLRFT